MEKVPLSLLLIILPHGGSYFLVSEPPGVDPGSAGPSRTGLISRIRQLVHEGYETLRRRFDYQENVCATLRHASQVGLIHANTVNDTEALARLDRFLEQRLSRHRRWMIIDGLLAMLGGLLTPIPGPNVFFLYPAVRALSHYFATKGIKRVNKVGIASTRDDSLLSRVQEDIRNLDDVRVEVEELGTLYNIHRLRDLLERL